MRFPALVLSFILIYGSQDVLAFDSITFSSIAQCGPFNISFVGGHTPPALPLTLTVIPFNSTNPISIAIPPEAWNAETSTGAAVTFLPFAAGTQFLASLDDVNGQGTGKVSDIIKILPSNDTGCLSAGENTTNSTALYTLVGSLSQCEPFALSFDTATETTPSVRVFRPKGPSFFINSTGGSPGMATFITEVQRGKEIVMLFDDGDGNRQTTALQTVGGDSSSSTDCIQQFIKSNNDYSKQQVLSKYAIIGIVAASGSIVASMALLVGVYVCRRKRLKETQRDSLKAVPAVFRPTFKSPRYVSGITLFGTTGIVTPTSPSGFGHRGIGTNGRSSWPERPASFSVLESSTRGIYHVQSSPSIITHSTKPRDFDVDLIPDMATISSSHSSIDGHSDVPAPPSSTRSHTHLYSYSQSQRATPDVPAAAERLSLSYPSSRGSEYFDSQRSNHTVSTTESGRRLFIKPFTAGVREMV